MVWQEIAIGPKPLHWFPANAVTAMCHQCVEIDKQIAHFKELARSVGNPQTVRSIDILIAKMEAKKDALHPERKE